MAYRKGQSGGLSPATRITQEIIARLEAGTKPWIKPWRGVPVSRPLRACGVPYRSMNVFWLWMVADMCGYGSPFWMTYNQAKELGAQVRKGEKSTIAIFYKSYTKEVESPDTGEKAGEHRRVLKAYPVFNADQVDGLSERFHPAATLEVVEPEGRQAELDTFFASIPAVLRHQGGDIVTTDGPFIESKEQIGGITVLKAADLDAALAWARKLARATTTPVEVRPFFEGHC